MEIEYDSWKDDHAVDISSDHESAAAPSQASNSVAEPHTSSSESIKHGPSHDQQADDHRKHGQNGNEKRKGMWKKASVARLSIASVFPALLVIIIVLITGPLAFVFTCTLIPGIIICLVLAYMITSLHQFCRCDDYADLDDEYDTDLGPYRYDLVVWMFQLTVILLVDLLLCLVLFRIGPFALRRLSLLDVRVWKWFLIGIIVLVYLGIWSLTHIVIHKAREKSSSDPKGVFFRVHILPILKGLFGVTVCGFYFLVEFLIMKLVPPLKRPKILGLNAQKWTHALVYVFIGLNVSRIISASVVAILQKKHQHDGKIDSNTDKEIPIAQDETQRGCRDPSQIPGFMSKGCTVIMHLLFRHFDPKKFTIYVVIGLRRSVNFVLVSIWLLVTWISHFEDQLKPSHDTTWILRVGTGTLICLVVCAILWLVKNSIMLWWKYRSIYNRFYDQVLKEGITLYLLGMICGQHLDVPKVIKQGGDQNAEESRKRRIVAKARSILVPPKEKYQSMNRTADDKTSYQPGIYAITRMVRYFLRAKDTFKDINASFEKLRKTWRNAHSAYDQNAPSTQLKLDHIKAAYGTLLSGDEFNDLLISQIKRDQNLEKQVNLQDFERWMESSHKTCFDIVSTLASAQRLARYLNGVMTAVIIFATICIWLTLVTRATKAVTVFTAPLLALSFIIGDTCATVFKGIIFLYIIHPYDIGDICIIKETPYEVKQIDFWTTTFLKVKTKEEVSYPNSGLFNDPIINKTKRKEGLDAYDSIEFILESDPNEQILQLKKKIGDHFLKEDFQKPQLEVNSDIRDTEQPNVTIHYWKHFPGVSNYELPEKMVQLKEELRTKITKSCPELKIKPAKEESK